jgi:uncharacterized membrane protein
MNTPAARLVSAAAALGLLTAPRRRGRVMRLFVAGALARALAARRTIRVQKTIHVRAPIDAVFGYFNDLRNFPRFMEHVRAVRAQGTRSHWVIDGPAGMVFEWDAEISRIDPNSRIEWHSLEGAEIEHHGVVRFEREGDGTRLEVNLAYVPPFGLLGHGFAMLSGKDPKHVMDDDLLRFKSLLEEGKARAHGEQVRREDLAIEPPLLH